VSGGCSKAASAAELAALTAELGEAANDARSRVGEVDGVATVHGGIPSIVARAGWAWREAARDEPLFAGTYARPKPVLLSKLMSRIGPLGIYSPFTGEANFNADAPLFSLPYTLCHEMAHQRGFAREDEANYLAFRVAVHTGDPEFAYPALRIAALYALEALAEVDEASAIQIYQRRSRGLRRDDRAWRDWSEQRESGVASAMNEAASAVHDTYLGSQGAADGARSYGRMLDLLLAERRARGTVLP
jgi:hypothetical protein